MLIRAACREDLPLICEIEDACFPSGIRENAGFLKSAMNNPRRTFWMGHVPESNRPAGYAMTRSVGKTLRLESIAILPEFRNRGWGRLFLLWIAHDALSQKKDRITLEAGEHLDGLKSWYEKQGFRSLRFLPDYYGKGLSAWRLQAPPKHILKTQ